jgi:hypothetical protein
MDILDDWQPRTGPRLRGSRRWSTGGVGDPSPDLYDDAQTTAAIMNYVGCRGNSSQCGRAWTDLDTASGFRRRRARELEKFGGQAPLGRDGQPAELGSVYVQFAAADAGFVTGQVYGSAGRSGQP